jgi:UDP-N-acetylmuramoyl-tripeptide--D-alanyl-D-alanine ligase
VDALNIALLFVLLRYQVYRSLFFLQIFQQSGYKFNEYAQWLSRKWSVLFPAEMLFTLVWALLVRFGLENFTTLTARSVMYASVGIIWFWGVKRYRPEHVKKPLAFTNRMKRLTGLFALLSIAAMARNVSVWFISDMIHFDGFAIIATQTLLLLFVPYLLFIAAGIVYPLEWYFQYEFKKKAAAKVKSIPGLITIAITGSYGKTSTKFFIRDVLKERFNVCSTPGSYNTPMGICKVINDDLRADHQVLILEMGARYPGNIDELCEIAQPDIAVWTNVGKAHLETFKTIEVIAQTKAAIINHLKPGGTAVINSDDPRVVNASLKKTGINVITAGLETGKVRAHSITYHAEGCRFVVERDNGESEIFEMSILGDHTIANMVLAVGVGLALGMRLKTIAQAAKSIKPVEHRLELKKMGGISVIDDAFNSNPTGAANAVDVLRRFEAKRRIIITPGMVELGAEEEAENEKFGNRIGQASLDKVILVGHKRTAPILRGIQSATGHAENVVTVGSLAEANEILKNYVQDGDVVLYENDLPDIYNEK